MPGAPTDRATPQPAVVRPVLSRKTPGSSAVSAGLDPTGMLELQRTVGNQATMRIIQRMADPPDQGGRPITSSAVVAPVIQRAKGGSKSRSKGKSSRKPEPEPSEEYSDDYSEASSYSEEYSQTSDVSSAASAASDSADSSDSSDSSDVSDSSDASGSGDAGPAASSSGGGRPPKRTRDKPNPKDVAKAGKQIRSEYQTVVEDEQNLRLVKQGTAEQEVSAADFRSHAVGIKEATRQGPEDSADSFTTHLSWFGEYLLAPVAGIALKIKQVKSRFGDFRALGTAKEQAGDNENDELFQAAKYGHAKVRRSLASKISEAVKAVVDFILFTITALSGGVAVPATATIKLVKSVASAVASAARKFKGVYKWLKGSRGKHRTINGDIIVDQALGGDPTAVTLLRKLKPMGAVEEAKRRAAQARQRKWGTGWPEDDGAMRTYLASLDAPAVAELKKQTADKLKSQ